MTYEQIDLICDSYNPILFILVLAILGWDGSKGRWRISGMNGIIILISVIATYSVVALDRLIGAWNSLGLDLSTHTMIAVLFSGWIWQLKKDHRVGFAVAICTGFYFFGMLYQKYHTVLDIFTSTTLEILIMYPFLRLFVKLEKVRNRQNLC